MTPPTIFAPGAVVEALAGEVDRLAAGDALDDEGRVRVDEDAHRRHRHCARGLVQRHGAVGVVDAVLLEDLEALLLPRAGDAEDRDLLRRVVAELEAGLDHAAGDDVHAGVGDDRHHHRDLVHAGLRRARAWPGRRPCATDGLPPISQ